MIQPKCHRCSEELMQYGALVISPPDEFRDGNAGTVVSKYHLCAKCWEQLDGFLNIPRGGVDAMTVVCQDLLELDKIISLHESFKQHWDPLVSKATAALTFKGGGTMR